MSAQRTTRACRTGGYVSDGIVENGKEQASSRMGKTSIDVLSRAGFNHMFGADMKTDARAKGPDCSWNGSLRLCFGRNRDTVWMHRGTGSCPVRGCSPTRTAYVCAGAQDHFFV